ncbi:tetratricopeptide repeat protein [Amycolatopsis sp. NPDC089917]|uniref:tetratricopeptide repeat protein n=1 Tax=Amycolatopsis sp. NPDC089917 TaxID=3155187 RepID=UPI003417D9C6
MTLQKQWKNRHHLLATGLDYEHRRRPGDVEDVAPVLEKGPGSRRFGAVPPRAGAFQRRTAARLPSAASGGTTVLAGLGGVGKTQLAADHAHTHWDTGQIQLLIWVAAHSREAITNAYAEVAVDLLDRDRADPDKACRRLLSWLAETNVEWLIVLDDLQAPNHLNGLWPPHNPAGQVVVTTRRRDAALHGHGRHIVDVDLFTPEESLAYLAERLAAPARYPGTELVLLAGDLGRLPLALAQAAAYLVNSPYTTVAEYRSRFADVRVRLAAMLPDEDSLPDAHQCTVSAAWSLSIGAADELTPAGLARPVLEVASLLSPSGIPDRLFAGEALGNYLTGRLDRTVTTKEIQEGLGCLRRFSLATLDPDQPHHAVRVHALAQRAVRDDLAPGAMADLAWAAADALIEAWPAVDQAGLRTDALIQALWANMISLRNCAEELLWQESAHPLLFRIAEGAGSTDYPGPSLEAMRSLHHQAHTRLGPEHADTLLARSELAWWNGLAGDMAPAVAELESVLSHQMRILGPAHPTTLRALYRLGAARRRAGDPADAITALNHALGMQRALLGDRHPTTFAIRFELAQASGEAQGARGAVDVLRDLLADQREVLGEGHPLTHTTLAQLAWWRGQAGEPASTLIEELKERLADEMERFGPDHAVTQATRASLAARHADNGDLDGAVEILLGDLGQP